MYSLTRAIFCQHTQRMQGEEESSVQRLELTMALFASTMKIYVMRSLLMSLKMLL